MNWHQVRNCPLAAAFILLLLKRYLGLRTSLNTLLVVKLLKKMIIWMNVCSHVCVSVCMHVLLRACRPIYVYASSMFQGVRFCVCEREFVWLNVCVCLCVLFLTVETDFQMFRWHSTIWYNSADGSNGWPPSRPKSSSAQQNIEGGGAEQVCVKVQTSSAPAWMIVQSPTLRITFRQLFQLHV